MDKESIQIGGIYRIDIDVYERRFKNFHSKTNTAVYVRPKSDVVTIQEFRDNEFCYVYEGLGVVALESVVERLDD